MQLIPALTGSCRALRRKKALQLSHTIPPKLHPDAGDPQTVQVNEPPLGLFA
jgi:hypothetical protein